MKNRGEGLGAGDWGTRASPPLARASITRTICPGAQESPPILKKNSFFEGAKRECY